MRSPTDGAMISPDPPERDLTDGEAMAFSALVRAKGLAQRLKRELAIAMDMDTRADRQLQDTWGWVSAMLSTELPAAMRALDEEDGE